MIKLKLIFQKFGRARGANLGKCWNFYIFWDILDKRKSDLGL